MSKKDEQVAISSDINHDACFDGSFDFARSEGCANRSSLYIPLANGTKEFRLITMLAGEGTDRLLHLLRHANLEVNPAPRYETISYCWGDSEQRSSIIVNGLAVSVPVNAVATLRRLRQP